MRQRASYSRMRRQARVRRRLMPVVGLGGSTIAVLVVTLPNLVGGRSASARAERLAYIGPSARVVRPTAAEPQPASAPVMKRLPPPALTGPPTTSIHRSTDVDRPVAALRTSPKAATTTKSVIADSAAVTRPATSAKPAPKVHAAADIGTPEPTASTSSGYVNPLAHASVTPERIDQGVDYGGTGELTAIGAGQITYVATSGTGWPGAFIEFRLSDGPDAGRYVFYAEGIVPAGGLHVGQTVHAGQRLATLTGSSGGIEIGWGAGIGTESYAMKAGQWKSGMDGDNVPTASGKSFSALVASLGGPAGKIEG